MKRCTPLRAAHDSGPRRAHDLRWVVCHSTEGGSAKSVAEFFATTAQASTQLVVDDSGCYRCLPDLVIPWGAPGANTRGLHVEHCGYSAWTRPHWLAHYMMLKLSAEHTAHWCWQYRIPRRWVGPKALRLGRAGLTTHRDCTAAFGPAGGHTDPGPDFPKDTYLQLVQVAYGKLVLAAEPRLPT